MDLVCPRLFALQQCRRGAPLLSRPAWATQWACRPPVLSDKQDAFVTGIAAEFPESRIGIGQSIFCRDVATADAGDDRHAKVKMRSKVVVACHRTRDIAATAAPSSPKRLPFPCHCALFPPTANPLARTSPSDDAGEVVLDYWSAVRAFSMTIRGRYNRPAYAWRRPWDTSCVFNATRCPPWWPRAHPPQLSADVSTGRGRGAGSTPRVRQQRQEIERVAANADCANGSATGGRPVTRCKGVRPPHTHLPTWRGYGQLCRRTLRRGDTLQCQR